MYRLGLFNADGSEAEISGNGTRCVAAYICSEQAKEKVVIRTGAGLKTCTFTSRNNNQYEFEIAMGKPEVGDELAIKLVFSRNAGRSGLDGEPALRHLRERIQAGLAGGSIRDRST